MIRVSCSIVVDLEERETGREKTTAGKRRRAPGARGDPEGWTIAFHAFGLMNFK